MANIFEINRPANKITLGTTGTTINVASHTASLLLGLDASKNLESVDLSGVYQPLDAVLTDIAALGVVADNEFIVGTGAGVYAHESGATARTSIGLGTGDSPTLTGLTLSGLTQGSVVFAGASGVLSQDNSNLFWDDTNKRLTIGTAAYMLAPLGITGDATLIGDRHEGIWIRAKTTGFIVQINVRGSRLEIGGGGALDTTPAMSVNYLTGKVGIGTGSNLSRLTVKQKADESNIGGTTTADSATTITGSDTTFTTDLGVGDRISLSSAASTYATVTAIASDTSLIVDTALGNGSSQTINAKRSLFRLDDASDNVKLIVSDQGNVGIGVTRPNAPLEVKGSLPGKFGGFHSGLLHVTNADSSVNACSVITGHNSYNTNTQLWYLGSTSSGNNDIAFINRQNGALFFKTNDITRLTIAADGGITFAGALASAWDMGSQALTNVNIDSGIITGITDLAVADGGTGASNAGDARTNLGLGNVENTQLSTWAGTTNIITLGTIATVGNITIADGGTIGQTDGPLLTFDDTNNFLEITGCKVGFGIAIPVTEMHVLGTIRVAGLEANSRYRSDWHFLNQQIILNCYDDTGAVYIPYLLEASVIKFESGVAGNVQGFWQDINGNVGIGVEPVTKLTVEGTLTLKEQASADGDTAAYGQDWVKNTSPCTRWFTDDEGNDFQFSGITTGVLNHSFTWDPPDIADGDEAATSVTVTGVAFGDFVLVSFSANVFDLVLTGEVTSANIVTVVLANNTGGARDLASGTCYIKVLKK